MSGARGHRSSSGTSPAPARPPSPQGKGAFPALFGSLGAGQAGGRSHFGSVVRALSRRRMLRLPVAAWLLAGTLAAAGCGPGAGQPRPWVEGVLLRVESHDIATIERFTLRDDRGQEWQFRVHPDAANGDHPITASHLRGHLAAGDRVVVTYMQLADGPAALQVDHIE